ncbi:ATPase associated with various cellular activities AAA_3 [Chloroherpeton thalassium ATCC 35110]|uniref:ATPase associated with various cellular activities AAA_3 n=1 Tax=Chloroherpeton thalassium (strain ATCC 35110 / GB-78) TaxID=517418 RepID=B3QSJ1_CHLT3|nr:MoxR family ATPase [Chloroherpeton thalassium]ACF14038.1 ATPase associated with various cellular activities AAA_3 [Chloroherpeton thalassium ATCC 35110]
MDRADEELSLAKDMAESYKAFRHEIHKVIIGQDKVIEELMISILGKGHCLLVGVPGLAKTLLVSTLAEILQFKFNRVQFTPDLMPSDITGTEILEEDATTKGKYFKFVQGPIFANIVLADEINRTPPKTQAALLEAMQEHQVTSAGKRHQLPEPFFVLATQNPVEQEGTYPLPEAQLDRFMFNLRIDYPTHEEEKEIVKATTSSHKPTLKKVLSAEKILAYQDVVRKVPVSDNVIDYAVKLVGNTRPHQTKNELVRQFVGWGAGPRASQYLVLAAKVRCLLQGRFTPEIADIQAVALPVLRHRLITNFSAEADGIKPETIITDLIKQ